MIGNRDFGLVHFSVYSCDGQTEKTSAIFTLLRRGWSLVKIKVKKDGKVSHVSNGGF